MFEARQSRRSTKEKGCNTCVSVVGVLIHVALTAATLCVEVFHSWGKAMLENQSLMVHKTPSRQGRWWFYFYHWKHIICKLNSAHLDSMLHAYSIYWKISIKSGNPHHLNWWGIYQWRYENIASVFLIARHKSLSLRWITCCFSFQLQEQALNLEIWPLRFGHATMKTFSWLWTAWKTQRSIFPQWFCGL